MTLLKRYFTCMVLLTRMIIVYTSGILSRKDWAGGGHRVVIYIIYGMDGHSDKLATWSCQLKRCTPGAQTYDIRTHTRSRRPQIVSAWEPKSSCSNNWYYCCCRCKTPPVARQCTKVAYFIFFFVFYCCIPCISLWPRRKLLRTNRFVNVKQSTDQINQWKTAMDTCIWAPYSLRDAG